MLVLLPLQADAPQIDVARPASGLDGHAVERMRAQRMQKKRDRKEGFQGQIRAD